jgi:hypothetical protein
MRSRQIVPMEMKGYHTDDKTGIFPDKCFQWKVDLIYIMWLRPNSRFCSKEVNRK